MPEFLFHTYNIWALTLAMILLYYIDRDGAWRMFSSHFLLATLMVIVSATPRVYWLPLAAAGLNLVCALPCMATIEQSNASRFGHARKVREFADAIKGVIVYEDGANPWCNTILTDRYPPALAGLPPGIGVSVYLRPREFPPRPKSKYLLVDSNQLVLLPVRSRPVRTLQLGGRLNTSPLRSSAVLAINALPPGTPPPAHER
jgi:hypothetical protein